MPSFFIRNLARIFALSQMENSSRPSTSYTPDEVAEGVNAWNKNMRWLIPFVKAADYRIVIENPKSHEKIVIDKDTMDLPRLSSSWLKRYDVRELKAWMIKEARKEKAREIAEQRGRAKYGDSFKASEQNIEEILKNL